MVVTSSSSRSSRPRRHGHRVLVVTAIASSSSQSSHPRRRGCRVLVVVVAVVASSWPPSSHRRGRVCCVVAVAVVVSSRRHGRGHRVVVVAVVVSSSSLWHLPMQQIVKGEKWIEGESWRKNTYVVSFTWSTRLCGILLTGGRLRRSTQLRSACLVVGQEATVAPKHQGEGGDIGERPLAELLRGGHITRVRGRQ
jgi:hypothetical protein